MEKYEGKNNLPHNIHCSTTVTSATQAVSTIINRNKYSYVKLSLYRPQQAPRSPGVSGSWDFQTISTSR